MRAHTPRRPLAHALMALFLITAPFAFGSAKGLLLSQDPAADSWPEFRLRIAWGGGEPRLWRGSITVSQGEILQPRLLGIEADEPGSVWREGSELRVEQPRPRTYDGVDITLRAPLDAILTVDLAAVEGQPDDETAPVEIPLREMIANYYNGELDSFANRLLVRRESSDILRLRIDNPSLVLSPGDVLNARLTATMLPVEAGDSVRLRCWLTAARDDDELWNERHDVTVNSLGSSEEIPLQVHVPIEEGAYTVHVEALQAGLRSRLGFRQTIVKRSLQFVVMADAPPAGQPTTNAAPERWNEITLIDPTSGSDLWSEFTRWPLSSRMERLSSGHAGVVNVPFRDQSVAFTRLPGVQVAGEVAWEAIPLSVDDVGKPHLVEVQFPADAPQVLGMSVLEPNAAGRLVPICLDSGVSTRRQPFSRSSGEMATHRLVFWPRTSRPLLLLTNQSRKQDAYFGKVRLLAGPEHLPRERQFAPPATEAAREWLAYFEKPLFTENFGATESVDAWSGRSLDDWQTFIEGTTRLGEYLQFEGRTGAIVTVVADGTALFPNSAIPPTPRFDTGTFFDSSQDPTAKDVLELLLREFDRRQLTFIPSIDFATRIPALEQIARTGGPETASLFWIGPDGRWLPSSRPPERGQAPYYNILHPLVQDALLEIVREVARRSARHPSFQGLAIRLGANGYAQLPGPEWGMDDETVARFERETGITMDAGAGRDRFSRRADLLLTRHRDAWLAWRGEKLHEFYMRVAVEVRRMRPDAKLYLLGTGLFASAEARMRLHPLRARQNALSEMLLEAGINSALAAGSEQIVFLRPRRVRSFAAVGLDEIVEADEFLEAEFTGAIDRSFAASPGEIFFHPPIEFRLPSLEEASPFDETSAWVVSQISPAGEGNRRRFAHAMAASDTSMLVDGGWLLPMGQEESLRPFLSVYRQLPKGPFQTFAGAIQPVVIRTLKRNDRFWLYAVNDSPWPARVTMRIQSAADPRGQLLGSEGQAFALESESGVSAAEWELQPYELKAAWFWSTDLHLVDARVEAVGGLDFIEARTADLYNKLNQLVAPVPDHRLPNGDFEGQAANDALTGWQVSPDGFAESVSLRNRAKSGNTAVVFRCDGEHASFVSEAFPSSETGRLTVSAWLKLLPGGRQPNLRIAIVGDLHGKTYYRYAPVAGEDSSPLTFQWAQFVFHVQDLPATGLENVRVRFDLMEPGQVAIDHVQVFDRYFNERELMRLSAHITRAKVEAIEKGAWTESLRLLDSYWPRFLDRHAPAARMQAANAAEAGTNGVESDDAKRSGFLDQMLPDWMKWR